MWFITQAAMLFGDNALESVYSDIFWDGVASYYRQIGIKV
jgi:hypothetical protein